MSDKKFSKIVQDTLIMICFSCGQYRGYKRDKKETKSLTERQQAKKGTHRVNRQLFADKAGPLYLANKHADAIRNWIYTWSFPWLDISGDSSKYRVVSLAVYRDKKPELNKRITRLKELWSEVFKQYESLVESDMKDQGTSADSRDYLSSTEVESRFYVDVQIKRVPVGGSVMMNALDNELDKLIEEQSKHDQKIVESLVGNVWERILEPLKNIVGKLTDPEFGFKDATIKDVAAMVETMRGFNITNNQDIENTLQGIEKQILMGWDTATLLGDPTALKRFSNTFRPAKNKGDSYDRKQLVAEAETIIAQMKDVI